jgi:hypothetical protein
MTIKLSSNHTKLTWTSESLENIWAYLIENGTVIPTDKLERCLTGIKLTGIDWTSTRNPSVTEIPGIELRVVLRGILTLKDQTWYEWTCTLIPPNTLLKCTTNIPTVVERKLK